MSWFSKKLKKKVKILDPIGAKLRKSTGGSYGDPMNWYQSKPKAVTPYQRPEKQGLLPDPGTGGPTVNLGNTSGYTPNPFAEQMAQAAALRQPNLAAAPPGMAGAVAQQAPGASLQTGMASPQQMQNKMIRPGGRPPGMIF